MRYLKAFEDNDKPRISGFGPNDFLCTYSNCAEFIKGKIYTGISWRRDNNDIEGKIEGENKSWVEVQMSNKENGTFEYKFVISSAKPPIWKNAYFTQDISVEEFRAKKRMARFDL